MKKILITILLLITPQLVFASTTYFVRVNGGTAVQCTGTTNADYSGTGTAQACAFNHPAWALGTGNTGAITPKMSGGDTLVIDDNHGISQAQYAIGYGMPNTSGCSLNSPNDWNCTLGNIPSGLDALHPTRILGSSYNTGCATKAQIWGTNAVGDNNKGIFTMYGSNNVDMECLEITDHAACGFRTGSTLCSEQYNGTSPGLYARGPAIFGRSASNLVFKNLDIHGLPGDGIRISLTNNITWDHDTIDGNHGSGWNAGNVCTGSGCFSDAISGTIIINATKVRFSGCLEAYPRNSSFAASDYNECEDGVAGTYADGFGMPDSYGTWIITDSEFSHNTSDGLDLLYLHGANIYINRSLFEGNDGNQLKLTGTIVNLTNSILIGNCTYLNNTGKLYGGTTVCRAGGVPLAITPEQGSTFKITNTDIYAATDSDASAVFEISNRNGTCNGTETYTLKNDIFSSPNASSGQWLPFYTSLSGSCQTAFSGLTVDHSIIYNFQTNPSGTGNVFTAPPWSGGINASLLTNIGNITLTSNVGGGISTSFWSTANDYNNFAQNASIDKGAYQFGTTSSRTLGPGQTCVATSDCTSGTCSSFTCSGGSGTANGGACTVSSTCTSGYCNGSTCANPPTCGDGIIQPPEVCDTLGPVLNGKNCIQLGFTGGTAGCSTGCGSYDTSGCTSSTVFPLTPILDNYTRVNQGPPPSTSYTTVFGDGMIISSNKLALASGSNGESFNIYNALAPMTDSEVYARVSTLGNVHLYLRSDNTAANNYEVFYNNGTNQIILNKTVSGSTTTLATYSAVGLSSGDGFGMSAVGTSEKAYKIVSGTWSLLGTGVTDSSITSGVLAIYMGNSTVRLSSFGGGALNPVTCGNGIKEVGEACDGADLGGNTCVNNNFASGPMACLPNCSALDTSSCVSASVCGNNIKETGELCDGTALNSQTCVGLGYNSGTPTCSSDCKSFVTTNCVTSTSGIRGGVTIK